MKLIQLLILLVFVFGSVTSCSSYINKMHKQFDKSDRRKGKRTSDKFAIYRKGKRKAPRKKKSLVSTRTYTRVSPQVKRKYRKNERRRVSADDLNDNGHDGSLWSEARRKDYLFSKDTEKRVGDIVTIEVMADLKNEITAELKRKYPDRKKKKRTAKGAPAAAAAAVPEPATADASKDTGMVPTDDMTKVYDKISSIVIEEINDQHVILRGRKTLLFKDKKRTVEVQVLVARRDINLQNTVSSSNLLESSIRVIR